MLLVFTCFFEFQGKIPTLTIFLMCTPLFRFPVNVKMSTLQAKSKFVFVYVKAHAVRTCSIQPDAGVE